MPHIVLNGKIDLGVLTDKFIPIFEKNESMIKIKEMYLNSKKWSALFETLVIDEHHQEFFIEVSTRDKKTTIRLYPLTDPVKTDAVKRAMVLVSIFIREYNPELKISKTNLQQYLSGEIISC